MVCGATPFGVSRWRDLRPSATALTKHSLYTPELQLLAETEPSTATTPAIEHEYIWFGGQPVAQVEVPTGSIDYYFNDHLGTPLLQTSSSGAVVWRAEYEPYGAVLAFRAGAIKHQPLRFPGQESDEGSEMSYNIFRWYRAGWGRYTQNDPMASLEAYLYASTNPLTNVDPLGLYTVAGPGRSNIERAAAILRDKLKDQCGACYKFFDKLGFHPDMLEDRPGSEPYLLTGSENVGSRGSAYATYNWRDDRIRVSRRLVEDTNPVHRICLAAKLAHELAHYLNYDETEGSPSIGEAAERACFGRVVKGPSVCGF